MRSVPVVRTKPCVQNGSVPMLLAVCYHVALQPSNNSDDDYTKVLEYSYLFYEAQQSGVLPSWNRLLYGSTGPYGTGYRKNAHTNENVNGISLAGGWYDAGGEGSGDR